jgi:hypothetical protein
MKRKITRGDHCSPRCPYLKEYAHPFFSKNAWCDFQLRNLSWYDYWLANCKFEKPDEALMRVTGRLPKLCLIKKN